MADTVESILACPKALCGGHVMPDGRHIKLGNGVKLGDYVTLGNGVKLGETPLYIQGRRYWIGYCGEPGMIRSGCINKPIGWWLENVERTAEHHGYTPDEQTEYRRHVEHVAAWMKLYGVDQVQQ